MRFADIPGLDDVKTRVCQHIATNQLAHAYLLRGMPSSALLPLSLAWSAYLLCTSKSANNDNQTQDACGKCHNCTLIHSLTHPDIHFFFPAKGLDAEGNIASERRMKYLKYFREFILARPYSAPWSWNEHLRQYEKDFGLSFNSPLLISRSEADRMRDTLSMTSFMASYKIVIVWGAEYLRKEGTNTILKTVESPPPKTLFFFLSDQSERLWPTLVSRLHPFFIRPLTQEETTNYLATKEKLPQEQALQWATRTENDIDLAIQLHKSKANPYDFVYDWFRNCWISNYDNLLKASEHFGHMSWARQQWILRNATWVLRMTLLVQRQATPLVQSLSDADAAFANKFAHTISHQTLDVLSELINEFARDMMHNAHARLAFLGYSLQIQKQFVLCRAHT